MEGFLRIISMVSDRPWGWIRLTMRFSTLLMPLHSGKRLFGGSVFDLVFSLAVPPSSHPQSQERLFFQVQPRYLLVSYQTETRIDESRYGCQGSLSVSVELPSMLLLTRPSAVLTHTSILTCSCCSLVLNRFPADAPGAVVMVRPDGAHQKLYNRRFVSST